MFCHVKNCRFSNTHITNAHLCGNCGESGHGVCECGNQSLVSALGSFPGEIPFDLRCVVPGCKLNGTHTTDGHHCPHCKKYGHGGAECPERLWQTKVDYGTEFTQSESGFKEKRYLQFQARKQMKWAERQVYTKIHAGQGCTWYARRANTFDKIELFFMHGDNWGQYGPSTDHRPKLDKFLEGYRCVDSE
jgi:hypothetical protein